MQSRAFEYKKKDILSGFGIQLCFHDNLPS